MSVSYTHLDVYKRQTPSWGRTVSNAQNAYARYPLFLWPPVLSIALLVLALSLLGEAIRDAFDPNTRR